MAELDLFEALFTQRAIRHYRSDPVPEGLIWQCLDAAIRAPSGTNRQPWEFFVLQDPAVKAKAAALYREARYLRAGRKTSYDFTEKGYQESGYADYLADHIHEAPAIVIFGVDVDRSALPTGHYASIFPAVQNFFLAARGLGLGTCMATVFRHRENEFRALLGIPDNIELVALTPLGYPQGRGFLPSLRRPIEEVTHFDGWGKRLTWERPAGWPPGGEYVPPRQ